MMTQEENVLLHKCKIVSQEVSRLIRDYNIKVGNNPAVNAQLSKAEKRSKGFT